MPSGCPRPGNIPPDELADAPCRPARALSQTGSVPDLFSALQKEARRSSAPGRRRAASALRGVLPGTCAAGTSSFPKARTPWPAPGDVRPCPAGPRGTLPPGPPAKRCADSADKKSRHALFRRSGQGPAGKSRNKARAFPSLRTCGSGGRKRKDAATGKARLSSRVKRRPQGRGRGFASAVMPRASLPRACHECCGRARAFSRSAARRSVSSVRDSTPRRIFRSTSR